MFTVTELFFVVLESSGSPLVMAATFGVVGSNLESLKHVRSLGRLRPGLDPLSQKRVPCLRSVNVIILFDKNTKKKKLFLDYKSN